MKIKFFLILSACILIFFIFCKTSQNRIRLTEERHIIDIKLDKCLEAPENAHTHGQLNCIRKAHVLWDKQLNEVYKNLMKRLNESSKASLRKSQNEWIKYRNLEIKFINSYQSQMQGSMYLSICEYFKLKIVKYRVLELEKYNSLEY